MQTAINLSICAGQRPTAVFAPTDIASLQLWLKAGTGMYKTAGNACTADGDVCGIWADSGPGLNDCIQSTTSKKPLYKLAQQNSYPGLLFDGVDDILPTPFDVSGQWHYFAVFKSATANLNSYYGVLDSDTNSGNTCWATFQAGTTQYFTGLRPTAVKRNNSSLADPFDIAPVNSGYIVLDVKTKNAVTSTPRRIGAMSAYYGNFYLVELVAFNALLSGTDQASMNSYLNDKFAIY